MSIQFPYKRTCRPFIDGTYSPTRYISDPDYSISPEHYIRAFLLIQHDFQNLLYYIEPCDTNLDTYSLRIYELFFRICVEIETNFRAILKENGYEVKDDRLNISDYILINKSHRLSSYEVKIPYWNDNEKIIQPFKEFSRCRKTNEDKIPKPRWYEDFVGIKHDRLKHFNSANFRNLVDAMAALVVVISAQFCREDFSPGNTLLALEGPNDGMESAIGGFFRVKFPNDWPKHERYGFDYESMKKGDWKILCYDYVKE